MKVAVLVKVLVKLLVTEAGSCMKVAVPLVSSIKVIVVEAIVV